eukprot:COSAG06_NODE_16076_length_1024_cov_0.802162_1_plen_68_part_10
MIIAASASHAHASISVLRVRRQKHACTLLIADATGAADASRAKDIMMNVVYVYVRRRSVYGTLLRSRA